MMMMMRRSLITAAAVLASAMASTTARAQIVIQSSTHEIREDWKLVVAQGDPANDGPQIMTYMSMVNDSSTVYAWFLINVRDAPNPYTPGGLMVQVWDYSDKLVASSTSTTATAKLNTGNEVITWTQRLKFNSAAAQLTYEILNGTSNTWGNFSSSAGLASIIYSMPIPSQGMALYQPSVSVKNSRVAWQPNNVTSMTLLTVRQYNSKGALLQTDNVNLAVNLTPQ